MIRSKQTRRKVLSLGLAGMLLLSAGCKAESVTNTTAAVETTKEETSVETTTAQTEPETEKQTEKETVPPTTKEEIKLEDFYDDMIAASFIQAGNTQRIQKAMQKAKDGEDVTIGYIGGSITEGASASSNQKNYAYLSYQYFKDTYGTGENVHFVNAGMGGTTSALGIMRYERDIWYQGYTVEKTLPDIVFIEFAVNDGDDPTMGEAYESLIRTILSAPNEPAVVLLFSVFESEFNLQDRLIPLGKAYDLPMISIKNAVIPQIKAGHIKNREFFANDGWHPLNFGHQIMADCVKYAYQRIEETVATPYVVPEETVIGASFYNMQMVDTVTVENLTDVTVNPGSFTAKDKTTGIYPYANREKMGDNWKHTKDAGNDSFVMTLTCKSVILAYKLANSEAAGEIEVWIDGQKTEPLICTAFCKAQKVETISGFSKGGWNNPWMAVLLSEDEAKEHTIEIKMASGSEEKEFTILGLGYAK